MTCAAAVYSGNRHRRCRAHARQAVVLSRVFLLKYRKTMLLDANAVLWATHPSVNVASA